LTSDRRASSRRTVRCEAISNISAKRDEVRTASSSVDDFRSTRHSLTFDAGALPPQSL